MPLATSNNVHTAPVDRDPTRATLLGQRARDTAPWLLPSASKTIPETNSNGQGVVIEADNPTFQATNESVLVGPNASTNKAAAQTNSDLPAIHYMPQAKLDAELANLESLSKAALAGDTSALDRLRTALDHCPHVWRRLADLQLAIEQKLIELVTDNEPLRAEAFRKRCSELRHELLEDRSASLLVKMAASRVVMCWLFCQFLELRSLADPEDLRCIKQLEQAERRYQVAMRTFQMARHADVQLQRLTQQAK